VLEKSSGTQTIKYTAAISVCEGSLRTLMGEERQDGDEHDHVQGSDVGLDKDVGEERHGGDTFDEEDEEEKCEEDLSDDACFPENIVEPPRTGMAWLTPSMLSGLPWESMPDEMQEFLVSFRESSRHCVAGMGHEVYVELNMRIFLLTWQACSSGTVPLLRRRDMHAVIVQVVGEACSVLTFDSIRNARKVGKLAELYEVVVEKAVSMLTEVFTDARACVDSR